MKSNLFFIIGIRRSGTSILRELIMKHPQIAGCEFEPHDLWSAVDLKHFPRLMGKETVNKFVVKTIEAFNYQGMIAAKTDKWYGAKFALNPGVKALEWVWLKKTFPEAKFIFITRDIESTWNSYCKQDRDSVRGLIDKAAYWAECSNIKTNFLQKGKDSPFIQYEHMMKFCNRNMQFIFRHLNLPMPNIDFKQFIKQPEF